MASIFAQRQIRLAALAALQSASLGMRINSPGDWNTPSDELPSLQLRCGGSSKSGVMKSRPDFTTTVRLELQARTHAVTAEAAQDAIEDLGDRIEQALFADYELNRLVQQFASVDCKTEISSEGREHISSLSMSIDCELFEEFVPADPPKLTAVQIHVDTMNPFDATGTYVNAPFPAAVSPAPRVSGPDGRDEGALNIQLPQ